jgi:glycosyltransferase involved in cell wall biosynthesis
MPDARCVTYKTSMARLHLVALPHRRVGTESCGCAYSNKIRLFVKMMRDRHEILLYAPESDPIKGATLVPCLSEADRIKTFGADDPERLPDWPSAEQTQLFNLNAATALLARVGPQELVLLSGGTTHKLIADALPKQLVCEPFVGYHGILGERSWAAYESYAHMHSVYARRRIDDIRWFDAVIPPFCDPDEFPHLNDGNGKYLLFLGRLINRKGPHIALDIAKRCGMPLYVAGAGGKMDGNAIVGNGVRLEGDVRLVGPVDVEARAKLLAGAKALLCPTTYCEPGGNVAIEAMMAGTPVITADFGVFAETIVHGVSGFHFRMLREAVEAVKSTDKLDPAKIRAHAALNYSLEAVASRFDLWFDRLSSLWGKGWYA